MATPEVRLQTPTMTVRRNSPGSLRLNTFNADGTVLDVHTGYSINNFNIRPSGSNNPSFANQDVKGNGDMSTAFDTTGVTLSWTAAQANNIAGYSGALAMSYEARLSNDSGATLSRLAQGALTIDNANGIDLS